VGDFDTFMETISYDPQTKASNNNIQGNHPQKMFWQFQTKNILSQL
jgi:hypothetical protein